MTITHITPAEFITTAWSGGTTSQLAIAPAGAVYADRDFLWRISSALVDLEESDFTALPDYNRYISTLQGSIRVAHDGGEELELVPYGVHFFDGGADTKSWGRCTDFNLMIRKGKCRGNLTAVRMAEDTCATLPRSFSDVPEHTLLVYCGQGSAVLSAGAEEVALAQGEAALISCPPAEVTVKSGAMSALMVAEMCAVEG